MKQICIVISLITNLGLYGQAPIFNSDINEVIPFSNEAVSLEPSWIKQREDLNLKYVKSLDPDRLLHNFRINAGLDSSAEPLKGWESPAIGLRGHFVGHYLSAVSTFVEKYSDTLLSRRLDYLVNELYKCQRTYDSGYLSAFPEKDFEILEKEYGGVWAPYYTYHKIMQGMLDVYLRTNNNKAYEILIGMADYVESRMLNLNEETIEKVLYSVGANPSNEAGAMNEILYKLYVISKNPKHLKLAKLFDRNWFSTPLSQDKDILSGLHSNTHIVLVNGYAQRYSITKEKKYKAAVVNFWNMLLENHAYINGSSSGPRPNVVTPTSLSAEHWGVPNQLSGTLSKEIAEFCVSHNTQKLTSMLFSWTKSANYADFYMNTFYNSILASQSHQSGRNVYHLPLGSPRKKSFLEENDFRCCNGTAIEEFSSLNSDIYFHDDSALYVNLYIPSKVYWSEKNFSLHQEGDFPMDPAVELSITSTSQKENIFPFELKFLIPSWAESIQIYINEKRQNIEVEPGTYLSLSSEWKNGDKIKLKFQYDFYIKAMQDNKNVLAIFYGPSLLAFVDESELILKGTSEEILNNLSKDKGSNTFKLINGGKAYSLLPLYDIEDQFYGVYATIRNY